MSLDATVPQINSQFEGKLENDLAIHSISTTIVDIPTKRLHKLSNTQLKEKNHVIVRLQLENGIEGIGEAATLGGPRWAEESVESIKAVIDRYLTSNLIGASVSNIEANGLMMQKTAKRNYAAKAAIEMAMFDALAKSYQLPVSAFLGGAVRQSFPVIWALASGDVGQEIEEAQEKLHRKEFKTFKIKIGFADFKQDLKRLSQLRQALGNEVELIVDVNQAWSKAVAIRALPVLEELDISLIEQPLPAGQFKGLAEVAKQCKIPVMVDESVFTLDDIALAGHFSSGSVLSLKLVKSGGLLEMKRAAAVASSFGMELYGGCLLESSIGAAAHLSVFSTLSQLHWGTEHFGPQIMDHDLVEDGLIYKDFEVFLPTGIGLGVTLNEDIFESCKRKQ